MDQEERAHRDAIALGRVPRKYAQMYAQCPCLGCAWRARRVYREKFYGLRPMDPQEHKEYRQWKADEAERRSREVQQQKAREEQERKAKERMEQQRKEEEAARKKEEAAQRKKKARERVADERSKEAARRARETQEKDAQRRLARAQIAQKQEEYVMEVENSGEKLGEEEVIIDIGWAKKKGVAKCLYCDTDIRHYSFRCPEGGAIACNPCKNKLSRFAPCKLESDGEAEPEDTSEDGE